MNDFFVSLGLIVIFCTGLSWLACRFKQPVILGYFAAGILIGPECLGIIPDVDLLHHISKVGVTLLLFLAGMVLHPQKLFQFLKTAVVVTTGGSLFTWLIAFLFLKWWGFGMLDSQVAALALMFSSTILVVKLLPTTTLHQKRMGGICIAILVAEDLIAVLLLLFLTGQTGDGAVWFIIGLPVRMLIIIVLAVAGEQYLLRKMMRAVDRYNELLIMLCLAWCLGISLFAAWAGLSIEVGAFIAGVAMARGKIALVLSEQLKPLRDFFLMFFFFVLGATFDFFALPRIWLPALILSLLIIAARPLWLRVLFRIVGESREFATETGFRLGQASEFALIIAVAATQSGKLSGKASLLVQMITIATMVISSCIVVYRFPTPIGVRKGMQLD